MTRLLLLFPGRCPCRIRAGGGAYTCGQGAARSGGVRGQAVCCGQQHWKLPGAGQYPVGGRCGLAPGGPSLRFGPLWNPHENVAHNGLFYFTAEGARAIAAYDPPANGKSLVTANRGSGSLSVFDLTGGDPLFAGAWKETIVPVCEGPEGIDISPYGREAWVGCHGENGIAIVDLAQKGRREASRPPRERWRASNLDSAEIPAGDGSGQWTADDLRCGLSPGVEAPQDGRSQ